MSSVSLNGHARTEPIHVLHVDDEPSLADLTATFLKRADDRFTVETATSASEGRERLNGETFDCIISDYDMPGQNGIEFLKAVREEYPAIPFILFTGKGSEEIASDAISAGVSDYLQKGSGTDRYSLLANRISNLVSQYRAESKLEIHARQQQRVAELGTEALAGVSLETLFDRAVELVADTLDTEYARVLDYRPEHEDLLLRAGVGWRDGLVGEAAVGTDDDSQAGHTIRSEEPIVVEDLRTEDRFRGPPLLAEHDVVSGVSVVIGPSNDPWGVLGTHSTEQRVFTDDDITFVQNVANVLATAIKRTEQEQDLRRKERRYQAMFNDPNILVGLIDTDGTVLDINETAMEYITSPLDEIKGMPFWETPWFDHAKDAQQAVREWIDRSADGEYVEFEADLVRPSGEPYTVEGVFRPVTNDDGEVVSLLISDRDITDRKQREQDLQRYEAYLEESTDIITVLDEEGTVSYQSPAVERILGYEREEFIGQNGFDYVHPDDVDEVYDTFTDLVAEPGETITTECRFKTADEEWRWLEIKGTNRLDNDAINGIITNNRDITERKEREERITETSARLEALFENSPDMIDVLDTDGILLDVNHRFCAELGYEEDELLGRPIWGIDQQVTEDDVRALLSDFDLDERRKFDGVYRRQDETTFPVEVHLLRLAVDGDDRFLAISRDITERKQFEEKIIALHDATHDIVQANTENHVAELVVEAVRDILDMPINSVVVHDDTENVLRTIASTDRSSDLVGDDLVFQPGESLAWQAFETGTTKRYGDVSTVSGRSNPDTVMRSEIIVPLGSHGVVLIGSTDVDVFDDVDVSLAETLATHAETALDRIAREQALERSEARYRSLTNDVLDTSAVGTFILDNEFEIVWINEATEEYFGLRRDALIGADKRQLIHDNIKHTVADSESFAERVLATYDDNTYVEEFECHVLADGDREERWLKHWSQPIESGLYDGGRIEHYTDITERKRHEQELEQQNDRLEEFASVVSHDLRNPLNVAQGRLELAQEECASEHLDSVGAALDRSHALIDDLLTLAREGNRASDIEAVGLRSITENCWQNVATAEATLSVESDRTIRADQSQFQQLLENLYRNSVEHGGDDVALGVGDLPDGFYIEDDGPGIPVDMRDTVFDVGYSTAEDGTGFGLSIVKQVADAHGWHVRITEGSEGGARFEITGVEFGT